MNSRKDPKWVALEVSLLYVVVSLLWIIFSDEVASRLAPGIIGMKELSVAKGCFYVAATGAILYFVLGSILRKREHAEEGRRRTEAALEAEGRRLRLLIKLSRDGIVVLNEEGEVCEANQQFCRMLGYTAEEMLRLYLWDIDIQWNRSELLEMIRLCNESGDQFETRHRRKDGAVLDIEVSVNATTNGGQKRLLCICRDITARKQEMQASEISVEFLRLVNESSDTRDMIRNATTFFQRQSGCEAVGIRLKKGNDYPYFETRGFPGEFVDGQNNLCHYDNAGTVTRDGAGNPVLDCMCGNVIHGHVDEACPFFTKSGGFWTNSIAHLPASIFPKGVTAHLGECRNCYQSLALLPLRLGQQRLGLLQFSDKRADMFTPEMVMLWERLADHLAVGLAKFAAEESLQASEAKYRTLFENMMNGFAHCRMEYEDGRPRDFVYLDVNKAFEEMTGLKDVVGKRVSEVIPGFCERDATLLETYGRVASTGVPENFETHVTALKMWFAISVYSPGTGRFVANFHVITKRKVAEEQLRKLSRAVEQSPVSIVITDADGSVEYVNPKFTEVSGYSLAEMLGRNPRILKSGETSSDTYREMWKTIRGGEEWHGEFHNRKKNGELYWEHASISPIFDEAGTITHFIALKEDITESKRTVQELRESEARFRQLAESIKEVFWITTPDNEQMLYVSPAYETVWGRSCESLYADPKSWFEAIHIDDRRQVIDALRNRAEGFNIVYRIRLPDNSIRWIRDRAFPVCNKEGQVERIVGVAEDITNQQKLEDQWRQAQKMEAIGLLAGGVAHDFNNILAVILMHTELLKYAGKLSKSQLEAVVEIGESAQRAATLTRQLLLFSRQQQMQPRDLDLNQVVPNIIKMLQRVLGEDIRMQLNFASKPLYIHADAGMIDQVLMNLAVNSRDAMPEGGALTIETKPVEIPVSMAATLGPQARPGEFACLRISDSGCGIAAEDLPRIFDPFFTTKDVGKGTGLGLATVFGIVQQHEGWIEVCSKLGGGTTFKIYLPRIAQGSEPESDPKTKDALPGGNETILLVEDNPFLQSVVDVAMTNLGYHVLTASSGAEAEEVWSRNRDAVNLLLTDLIMPEGMNGKELAQRLVAQNPSLKVVYTSGYSAEIAGKDLRLEEGVNFLPKPFQTTKLARIVRQCLDRE